MEPGRDWAQYAGLRVGEVKYLKPEDILRGRMQVRIRQSKGKKISLYNIGQKDT